MRIYVIIATKGRAKETLTLLDFLHKQTLLADYAVFVGTSQNDLEGLSKHPYIVSGLGEAIISTKVGATAQRNYGLEVLRQKGFFKSDNERFFCVFFDDDYRPSPTWLEYANKRFEKNDIVGLTGCVLADGIKTGGLTEDQAVEYLEGRKPKQLNCSRGANEINNIDSVYGCNMAFVDAVTRETYFDEALPLYSWQEDRDYTGMANKIGKVIYYPDCTGVHLGIYKGRVDPPPINSSTSRVGLDIIWNVLKECIYGEETLYGRGDHRSAAAC